MSLATSITVESVAAALPCEQARARALLVRYIEIGPAGAFGAMAIEYVTVGKKKAGRLLDGSTHDEYPA